MRRGFGGLMLAISWCACAQDPGGVPPGQVTLRSPAVQAAAPGPTGVVIGTVVAQDTQRPARFAQVQLQSVEQAQASAEGDRFNGGFGGGSISVRTDVDGTFEADNIVPGDYYVTATATGYVAERTLMQAQIAAGADPTALLASLPQVHVAANSTSSVTVAMQRGGALAGHIEWEDGSPAAGVAVQTLPGTTAVATPPVLRGFGNFAGNASFATTDDKGNFRLSGMPTGDYIVLATLQPGVQTGGAGRNVPQFTSPIRIYAPGVFRKTDAKPINVRAGDERTDLRIVLDLRGLHVVSGSVSSNNPGNAVASGRVFLTDTTDASVVLQGNISSSGTFRLPYIPAGNYTLQVSNASTQASNSGFRGRGSQGSNPPAVTFQPFSQALTVGDSDLSGVAISLTPVAAKQ